MDKNNPRSTLAAMAMFRSLSQSISVVAKLGVADFIAGIARNIKELAALTQTKASFLYRMMRLLANFGIFNELPGKFFQNNDISELLRADHPESFRAMAIWLGEKPLWQSVNQLHDCLKTGKSGFQLQNDCTLYDYLERDRSLHDLFYSIMSQKTKIANRAIIEQYPFQKFKRIIDIGGGRGDLIIEILSRYDNIIGAIFDLPLVIKQAIMQVKHLELENRCYCISGDFFKDIPKNHDLYILMNVLHNWNDEACVDLLRACYKRLKRSEQRIIIIESIIDDAIKNNFNFMRDLEMMLLTNGGRERTLDDFNGLFVKSNLSVTNIYLDKNGYSIIELSSSELL